MRLNLTSGSLFQGLTAIGGGFAVMFPDTKWIGGIIILVGVLSLIFDAHFERGHLEMGTPQSLGRRLTRVWPQYLMVAGALALIVGFIAFLQLNVLPSSVEVDPIRGTTGAWT